MNRRHNGLRVWARVKHMCHAWLYAAPQGFTTEFSQKKQLSQRLHAVLAAPGARKKGVVALCVAAALALGAGGLFALRVEQPSMPGEEPLVVLTDYTYEMAAKSWVRYYKHLYPKQRITLTVLPPAHVKATGEYTAAAAEKRNAMLQEIRVQLMAGEGPDVFLTGTTNLWEYAPDMPTGECLFPDVWKTVQAGAFADMADYLESDADFLRQDYIEPLFDAGKLDGKQYLIPLTCDVSGVVLNAALLDATDFDETAAARDFNGFWGELSRCVPPSQLNEATVSGTMLMQGLDTPLVNYEGNKVQVRTEEVFDRVAAVQTLEANDRLPEAQNNISYWEAPMETLRETILLTGSSFRTGSVAAGLLAAEAVETRFFPVPNTVGGVTAQIGLYGAVRANSTQKTAAWLFLKIPLSEQAQREKQIDRFETDETFYLLPDWMIGTLPVHKAAMRDRMNGYQPANLQGHSTAALGERITADLTALPDRITRGEVGTQAQTLAVLRLCYPSEEEASLSQEAWLDTVERDLMLQLEE